MNCHRDLRVRARDAIGRSWLIVDILPTLCGLGPDGRWRCPGAVALNPGAEGKPGWRGPLPAAVFARRRRRPDLGVDLAPPFGRRGDRTSGAPLPRALLSARPHE